MALLKQGRKLFFTGVGVLVLVFLLLVPSLAFAAGDRKIPDPEYFFSDFDVEVKSESKSSRWVVVSGGEKAELFSAGMEYIGLLKSSAYPFTVTEQNTDSETADYYLCYSGENTYKNPSEYQIAVRLRFDEGAIWLFYFDCNRFSFVAEDEYSGTLYDLSLFPGYSGKTTVTPTPTKKATATPKSTKKATTKPTATPKPTKKVTATPKVTKKVTATPKVTKKATATPKATKKATATPKAAQKTATPSGTLVSTGIDLSYLSKASKNGVQDVRYWSRGTIPFSKKPLDMDGFMLYKFKCSRDVLEAYIDDLCENGFTLVEKYDKTSTTYGKFIEYALICDNSSAATIKGLYTKVACHIDIWKDDVYWRMDVADGLTYCDMGLRQSGSKQSIGQIGDSAEAGLLYKSGTYFTDDGRLSAKAGKADVLVNGKSKTGTCTVAKKGTKKYLLTVDGFGSGELAFTWDKEAIRDNIVYLHSDFEGEDVSMTLTLDGTEMTPKATGKVHFSSLILRVMHYDTKGDAVFYLYAKTFEGDTVEMLTAVNMKEVAATSKPTSKSTSKPTSGATETVTVGSDTTIYIKVGQTVVLKSKYNSSYDMGTMYTTYEWNLSGNAISMEGEYDNVTIKGLKKGTATITLKYCYTKDEPDVLTGITRHNAKARNRTYTIVVE